MALSQPTQTLSTVNGVVKRPNSALTKTKAPRTSGGVVKPSSDARGAKERLDDLDLPLPLGRLVGQLDLYQPRLVEDRDSRFPDGSVDWLPDPVRSAVQDLSS
jgi:hypothetical protein